MRRRRTPGRAKHGSRNYSGITVVLLLVLVAAFIYAFKSLGFYDKLVQPVTGNKTSDPTDLKTVAVATISPIDTVTQQPATPVTAGSRLTEEIKMSTVTLYGVQLGVYSKLENAQSVSESFRKLGSAGYILKEETLFRVIDSVYYTENDAKAVRDELRKGSSPDACVIRIQAKGVNWKVTATREQIDTVRGALVAFQTQIVALINTQKSLQQNSSSVDYIATVKTVSGTLKESQASLERLIDVSKDTKIGKLDTCLKESAESLDKLAQTSASDTKALMTGLKYSIIDILLNIQSKIMG